MNSDSNVSCANLGLMLVFLVGILIKPGTDPSDMILVYEFSFDNMF